MTRTSAVPPSPRAPAPASRYSPPMSAAAARRPRARPVAVRVPHDERRRQLLDVAGRLLTERGAELVQITEVAERAGVSRPLVYRLFPTRQALVRALLEDFAAHLSARFQAAVVRAMPGTVEGIAAAFVVASCETIEAKGAGPWRLLDGSGAEPELARLGRATLRELLEPWEARLQELTGRSRKRNANVMWILTAAGRAALDGWIDGSLSRREAIDDGTRTVVTLLQAFGAATSPGPQGGG